MGWLLAGVLLWSAAHMSRRLSPGTRAAAIAALGEKPYKGLFALVVLAALAAMVAGWRAHAPAAVHAPPEWAPAAAAALMFAALFLFAAALLPSNARRVVRHPQLTGVVLWAVAHLLANGDDRALALFGGLGLWAAIQIPLIDRDGAPPKPDPVPALAELKPLGAAAAAFALLFFAHARFAGVPLAAGGG